MADVTVVIPTHNRRLLLMRTLHSVLTQRDVDLEVVVVDDGGSDGTEAALTGLADPRVTLVRHPSPRGVSAARNTGIEKGSAAWLAFVDDDDLWAPTKLARQLDAVTARPQSQWSCTGAVNFDSQYRLGWWGEPPEEPDLSSILLRQNVIPGGGSGVLASRELVTAVGGFDEALSNLADWDFYTRLALKSPMAAVSRPLLGYFVHPAGMSNDVKRSQLEYHYLEVKYGRELARRGLTLNHEERLRYLSSVAFRTGHRMLGLRMQAELVQRSHRYRHTVRAVAVGMAPVKVRTRLRRTWKAPMPPGWRAETEAWLSPYASDWCKARAVA
jgi:glycosyltransferase involved in cell wall biosynthesis